MSGKGRSDKGENCQEDHTREKTVRKIISSLLMEILEGIHAEKISIAIDVQTTLSRC